MACSLYLDKFCKLWVSDEKRMVWSTDSQRQVMALSAVNHAFKFMPIFICTVDGFTWWPLPARNVAVTSRSLCLTLISAGNTPGVAYRLISMAFTLNFLYETNYLMIQASLHLIFTCHSYTSSTRHTVQCPELSTNLIEYHLLDKSPSPSSTTSHLLSLNV
jgi:hypothetical protein